jgi:ADP-heptose:LPS heptosyltransferase
MRLGKRRFPRRWWLFRPIDLLVRLWPVKRPRRGILVVRMDGIGDMVLAHTALCRYPEVLGVDRGDITIVGCNSWAALASALYPGFRFRAIDEHAFERNPFYRFKVALWVRRQNFAMAICDIFLRRPLTADALVYLSAAPHRIVAKPYLFPKAEPVFEWYLARCDQVIDTGAYPTHEIDRHFRFLSVLAGREIAATSPALPWPRAQRPIASPYVVLNMGSNEPGRRWPIASFLVFAERLAKSGLAVVFVGGKREASLSAVIGAMAAKSQCPERWVDWINETTLPELLDLLQHAAVAVSSDTGTGHLAIALGLPAVLIVGGGHYTSFMPYPPPLTPPRVRFVYHEMPCYYCLWKCTQPHEAGASFPCVETVTVDEVCAAIDAVRVGA